jgi:hypothetical protein
VSSRDAQEFALALQAAVQGLRQFAERAEAGSRALAEQERRARAGGGSALGGAFAAAGAVVGGVAPAIARADPAAVGRGLGFASSGDFAAAEGQVGLAALAALDQANIAGVPVGRIFSETTGLAGLERQLAGAQQRTLDVTADLARYGFEVSPEFRADLVRGFAEQEQRVEAERRAVAGEVGKLAGPEALETAERFLKPLMETLERIARATEAFGGGGGGAPR